MSRISISLMALALAGGCGPALPDRVIDGTRVRYHHWADEGPPCPEAIDEIDRFIERLGERFERPLPAGTRIDYYKLHSIDELRRIPECAVPHAGGCAVGTNVYAVTATQDHELTHALLSRVGYPPQLFAEGIAVVFGCGPARFSGDPLPQLDLAPLTDNAAWARELGWPNYLQAAAFTRFLIEAHGLPAFTAFYAGTPHGASAAQLDEHFRAAFGRTFSDALVAWRAGPAPREGEACIAFDDRCDGSADLAVDAVGASGQLHPAVRCVDAVASLQIAAVPTTRLRFTAEQEGRALTVRPCDRSGSPGRTFVYAYPNVGTTGALVGRNIDAWLPLQPGRYSLTVTRTALPLTQLDSQAPVGGTVSISASGHEGAVSAGCSAVPLEVPDDTWIVSVSGTAAALAGDAGVVRLMPQSVRRVDGAFAQGLSARPWLCSACNAPPACSQLEEAINPMAQLSGPSNLALEPVPDGGFTVELVLGQP